MKQLFIIFILYAATACTKDVGGRKNCNNLKTALVSNNVELMKIQINQLIDEINATPVTGGTRFARQFQDELVKALNTCIVAESLCYFCVQTIPEQSEIRITAIGVSRILDISFNTTTQKLEFRNMHD